MSQDIAVYHHLFADVEQYIKDIEHESEEIKNRLKIYKQLFDQEKEKSDHQFYSRMEKCTHLFTQIKNKLDVIDIHNRTYESLFHNPSIQQARKNIYKQHVLKIKEVSEKYSEQVKAYKQSMKEIDIRKLQILHPQFTKQEMDHFIRSNQVQQLYQQDAIHDDIYDAIQEIEKRHVGIVKLEQTVAEMHQLFQDLSVLVCAQQDTLDHVESNISDAAKKTLSSVQNLQQANRYNKKAAKTACCILFVVLLIVVIIISIFIKK